MLEDENSQKLSKRKVLGIFVALLTTSLIASTLASTIKIGGSGRIEFGQGVYNLKACDSFVNLNLRNGSDSNVDKVKYLDLSGFDKFKCKSKFFTIKVQKNGVDLDLFNYLNPETSTYSQSKKIVIFVSNEETPVVSLVYTYGVNEGNLIPVGGDSYQVLTYSSGIYTVEFLQPIVLVADVTGTTFESSDNYT